LEPSAHKTAASEAAGSMQRQLIVKSIGLGGASDLTLLAPLKTGFVPSLDSVTYKTRVKRVLAELHGARQSAHEYATARLLSDAVERVGVIHSVRVAVMEPEDEVLLSVTFDGPWEAYVRVLWDKVGALLDLIFCNTQGYPNACEHTFEQWAAWARSVQRETGFFYGPPQTSATDMLFERRLQRMRERRPAASSALDELRAAMPSAEEAVDRLTSPVEDTVPDDPPIGNVDMLRMGGERVRTYLQGLAGLYRLTDLYVPGTEDGPVLWRAAIELLREFMRMRGGPADVDVEQQRARFERALDWLFKDHGTPVLARERPKLPRLFTVDAATAREVQGGILRPYEHVTHGVLLLFRLDTCAAAAAFVSRLLPVVTRDEHDHAGGPGVIYRNVAFTPAGLRAMGMDEDTVALFPEEFLQGMARRAGALGDVRHNHPRRWRLPGRFQGIDRPAADDTVDLAGVHLVVQCRTQAVGDAAMAANDLHDAAHPLRDEVQRLAGVHAGARLLAVQCMRRRFETRHGVPVIVEHFGYADGGGQPDLEWREPRVRKANRVPLGEVLWGHPSQADLPPDAGDARRPWMADGSFMVLRKYRQFPHRLDEAVTRTAAEMQTRLGGTLEAHRETVYAKLMGRRRDDGAPLAPFDPSDLNDFHFDDDPQGRHCPLHAHIRRAHPRRMAKGSERVPRIVRRGMSFGPDAAPGTIPGVPDGHERGLVFMAYNQSLGEQFEVVQRWLTGGNSTGATSATACPIVGVPENGYPRIFRFEADDADGGSHVFSVELEARTPLFEDPAVPTQLEWGLYLFAPSLGSLNSLAELAAHRAADRGRAVPWEADAELRAAKARIRRLLALGQGPDAADAWKAALEDPDAIDRQQAAALWAAIRLDHGGALDTPYGTLVADRQLALDVFRDPHRRYSVSGQRERMISSFGDIYLGLDDGDEYRSQSQKMNEAIGKLDFDTVFAQARDAATHKIDAIVALARKSAKVGEARFEALFDAREVMDAVLGDLTDHWFGLQHDAQDLLKRGSTHWSWKEGDVPLYPGHYTALSRNMFQPNPGPVPQDLGRRYGLSLRDAMRKFVERHHAAGRVPQAPGGQPAPLAKVAFAELAAHDADFVGRLINGVVMGYTPTIIGAVANVLLEWRRNERFGALRSALAGRTDAATAQAELSEAMRDAARMRPMPQITWRTVTEAHDLLTQDGKAIALKPGDKVVIGIVGGTQQSLADGESDGKLMFGGHRAAGGPTHACPGYQSGIAAMLGSVVALLARPDALREGPSPLTYLIEGPLDVPVLPSPALRALRTARRAAASPMSFATFAAFPTDEELPAMTDTLATPSVEVPAAGSRTGLIMAWGDSWLAYELGGLLPFGTDLRDCLVRFGYKVPRAFCDFSTWGTIRKMAEAPEEFCAALDHAITPHARPKALLLSGGGNDSTRSALAGLMNRKGTGPVLDVARTAAHIEQLRRHFVTVLKAVKTVYEDADVELPVLIPGYDHPLPNGKGLFPLQREWLFDVFQEFGYAVGPLGVDRDAGAAAMRQLIDDLNVMMSKLKGEEFPFVRYVDLRGTVAELFPGREGEGWQDDLHPVDPVFEVMAAKIDAAI
jgi:Dyp-type peroxidase family